VSGTVSGSNVYEFNTQARTQTLVSHQAGLPGTAAGGVPPPDGSGIPVLVVDDDGHMVSYVSKATNLVTEQSGPDGVANIFIWLRNNNTTILASGQGGSPTATGNDDSDGPLLTRASFPTFSSRATNLVNGVSGTVVAYINTLVELALSSGTVAPGGAPGSLVGYLTVTSAYVGNFVVPLYTLPPGEASNALFGLPTPMGSQVPLVTRFQAGTTAQQSYQVHIHVDIGFGDYSAFLQFVGAAPASPSGNVGGQPAARPLSARLVTVKVGKKKKTTKLLVQVFYADTRAEKEEFFSPYQKPAFTNIKVSVRDSNGDGIPDQVVVTAKKGKRKVMTIH
jgi:hypothetical protein